MSQVNTFLIKIGLTIVYLCLLQSCTSETCENQIESKLFETEFLTKKKAFKIENQSTGWVASGDNNERIIESRYAYKIEIDLNSDLVLLNHRQLNLSDISNGLEKELLELVNRFGKEDVRNIPNTGFQIIYSIQNKNINIYIKKISKIICAFNTSVEMLQEKSKNIGIEEEKILKLLQLRFSFFPN